MNTLRTSWRFFLLLFGLSSLLVSLHPAIATAQTTPDSTEWTVPTHSALDDTALIRPITPDKNFGRTAVKIIGVNSLVWFYDRYIRPGGGEGFRIGFNSWKENLANGFEWDDNNFNTNQFAHPFHGNLYFNAARSNGYTFWESVPFTFAGSYMWEFFGETHHPSMNDWIATSVGGVAMGEMLYRLSSTVLDNTATGSERNWRETGGFVLNPMRGLNRIIDGDWGRVHQNPVDRYPNTYASRMALGLRTVGDDKLWDSDTTRVFCEFEFDYGDPFFGDMDAPYDHFSLEAQFNFGDASVIGRIESDGLLAGTYLYEDQDTAHILGAFHHFDFLNTHTLEYGAQSVGAGLLSRFSYNDSYEIRTEVHLTGIILGAASSDYFNSSGRLYDYGPGLGVQLSGSLLRRGYQLVHLEHEQSWIHAVNGNQADHHLSTSTLRLGLPVYHNIGVNLEYNLLLGERLYKNFPDVSLRHPQLRTYITWQLS